MSVPTTREAWIAQALGPGNAPQPAGAPPRMDLVVLGASTGAPGALGLRVRKSVLFVNDLLHPGHIR